MKTAKIAATLFFLLAIPSAAEEPKSFRDTQWKYPRVRTASKEKDEVLRQRFREKNLAYPPRAILLRAFKQEAAMELWASDANDKPYVLVHEYRICTSSGTLGRSAVLETNRCRRDSTNWIGLIRKAISS